MTGDGLDRIFRNTLADLRRLFTNNWGFIVGFVLIIASIFRSPKFVLSVLLFAIVVVCGLLLLGQWKAYCHRRIVRIHPLDRDIVDKYGASMSINELAEAMYECLKKSDDPRGMLNAVSFWSGPNTERYEQALNAATRLLVKDGRI